MTSNPENAIHSSDKHSESRPELDPVAYQLEQLRRLYQRLPLILLADIVAGLFLFGLLFSQWQSPMAFLWLALLLFATLARAFLAKRFMDQGFDFDNRDGRSRFLIVGAFISGLIWGCSWLLLPTDPSLLQLLIIGAWLVGMQAGAASTMVLIKKVFLAYTLPSFFCFTAYLLIQSSDYGLVLAAAYAMYLCFILPIGYRVGREFNESIALRLSNTALQETLENEANRLTEKEAQLREQLKIGAALKSEKALIDERLQAETGQRLLILDSISEAVVGLDSDGNITFANASALDLLGLAEEKLLGQRLFTIMSDSSPQQHRDTDAEIAISSCFKDGQTVPSLECTLFGKNNIAIPVRMACTPIIQNEAVLGAVISFINISDQKEMQAMLMQSQKMEAVGRLTGGVAHDFNNLLTVILGNLQFLKKRLADDEGLQKILNRLIDTAKRGGDLNNRLLSFSSEQNLKTELVMVDDLLSDMQDFLSRVLTENIELEIQIPEQDIAVLTDRTQLQNAILNICVNARDAMPQGGTLKVESDLKRLDKSLVSGEEEHGEADYAVISITDNGVGIAAEIQKKIFEPFFTTKEKGQGTGLGLATVYGFIRQSGGNITVQSREGEWTRFNIYLPTADTVSRRKAMEQSSQDQDLQFEGTAMIVEDDPVVREVAIETLRSYGFDIVTAGNGQEGLEKFSEHPEIKLVFSDVVMPGRINGIEMAESIEQVRPGTPIILVTGYTDKAMKNRILEAANVVVLSKPYDTETLPGVIHKLLMRNAS
jgi:PAS domain S-box-containing protein